jgi:hypothetical protein
MRSSSRSPLVGQDFVAPLEQRAERRVREVAGAARAGVHLQAVTQDLTAEVIDAVEATPVLAGGLNLSAERALSLGVLARLRDGVSREKLVRREVEVEILGLGARAFEPLAESKEDLPLGVRAWNGQGGNGSDRLGAVGVADQGDDPLAAHEPLRQDH